MDDHELEVMDEEERDIVEFSDEDGNTLLLEVLDYFFYNGEEFAVLGDAEEECDCGHDHDDEEACDCEHSLYIMKVITSTDENGEEMEEFVPVEDGLMDQLIEVVQTRFSEDDDDEDEDEEFEEDEDEEDEE